jgi:hypothetical protein
VDGLHRQLGLAGVLHAALSNTVDVTTPEQTDFTPPGAPANLRGRADVGGCELYLRVDC